MSYIIPLSVPLSVPSGKQVCCCATLTVSYRINRITVSLYDEVTEDAYGARLTSAARLFFF